ncbi:2-methoxy-6-polyprenyl-1,4-benzoquinol methylase, mitochondrial [subsurface metagenome]
MHDNPLLLIFRNPYKLLKVAGLKLGQKVMEAGCGPGFFTIPAAKIVGEEGFVYAVDVHPLAIEKVKEKTERGGIKNVTPILANASNTGLPDRSIDLALLFGLQYIADGLVNVISEIHRILKQGGVYFHLKKSESFYTLKLQYYVVTIPDEAVKTMNEIMKIEQQEAETEYGTARWLKGEGILC